MKNVRDLILWMGAFGILSVQTAHAELPVPRHVFTMDQLEEAKAEAIKAEEPLIFVYTSTFST